MVMPRLPPGIVRLWDMEISKVNSTALSQVEPIAGSANNTVLYIIEWSGTRIGL